jgi:hypothetical protein
MSLSLPYFLPVELARQSDPIFRHSLSLLNRPAANVAFVVAPARNSLHARSGKWTPRRAVNWPFSPYQTPAYLDPCRCCRGWSVRKSENVATGYAGRRTSTHLPVPGAAMHAIDSLGTSGQPKYEHPFALARGIGFGSRLALPRHIGQHDTVSTTLARRAR